MQYKLPSEKSIIISNMPFNYTADFMNKFLDCKNNVFDIYIVIQKEALETWAGKKLFGKEGITLKSLRLYPFYEFRILHKFKRSDFKPIPSVNCLFVKISMRNNFLINKCEINEYNDFMSKISKDRVGEGIWKKIIQ